MEPEQSQHQRHGRRPVVDTNQAVLRIQRDREGRILRVTDPAGRQMRFEYDQRGHLSAIDHPRGRFIYRVSPSGQLLSAQVPEAHKRSYRYDDPGFASALTAIEVQRSGEAVQRVGTWSYDAEGRVSEYRGPNDALLRFRYFLPEANGLHRTDVLDREGRARQYHFRQIGGSWQPVAIIGQDCDHCALTDRHYRYSPSGRLNGIEQRLRTAHQMLVRRIRHVHDAQGRITAVYAREWREPLSTEASPASAFVDSGNEPMRLRWRYVYADEHQSQPVLIARPSADGAGSQPEGEYRVELSYQTIAGMSLPVSITESGYSHGRAVSRTMHIRYDENTGLPQEIDGPLPGNEDTYRVQIGTNPGHEQAYALIDRWGNPVDSATGWWQTIVPWLPDVAETKATMTAGRMKAAVRQSQGRVRLQAANGASQTVVFDDFGRITQLISPDAGTETIFYDAADRVVKQTDSAGGAVYMVHDAHGRLLQRTVTGANDFREITRYRYEGERLIAVEGASASEHYRYDAQGRLVEKHVRIHPGNQADSRPQNYPGMHLEDQPQAFLDIHPDAHTQMRSEKYVGDRPAALPETEAGEQVFVTRYEYEGDRTTPVRTILPMGAVVQRRVVSDENSTGTSGHRATVQLDLIEPMPAQKSWLQRLWSWHQPSQGERQRLILRRAMRAEHAFTEPSHKTHPVQQSLFDTRGTGDFPGGESMQRLPDQVDASADSQARMLHDVWELGNGHERQLDWQNGRRLVRMQERHEASVAVVGQAGRWDSFSMDRRYEYEPSGRVGRITEPHQQTDFVYDPAGRLIIAQRQPLVSVPPMREAVATGAVDAWWYAYDDNGNRLLSARHLADAALSKPGAPWTSYGGQRNSIASFSYGQEGQDRGHAGGTVKRSLVAFQSQENVGLLKATDSQQFLSRGSMLPLRRIHYLPGSNRLAGIEHDAVGRPLRWQGWMLNWHPGGQISEMRHEDGRVIRYWYNHRGERVARHAGADWHFYDYENNRLVTEAAGTAMRSWVYEAEIPVAMIESAGLRLSWLHVDHRGLPLARSDEQGHIVWQSSFGPFGEPATQSAAADFSSPFGADPTLRFPGQWVDAETGLYYNLMRDYDPNTGRYLSPDPLGVRAGPNPYLYVAADPVGNVDPTGLLLFAFDGTHNAPDEPTNIWYFSQLYLNDENGAKGAAGHNNYVTGVGVGRQRPGSGEYERSYLFGLTGDDWTSLVNFHLAQFLAAVNAMGPDDELNIDVVGFSRGAPQALEFGRIIAALLREGKVPNASRVNLRFMGLLDPVFTYMYDGVPDWETACEPMRVDDEWSHVVNIIAAHERREGLFNTASLGRQVNVRPDDVQVLGFPAKVREEFVMAGAHSDVGGGYKPQDGDLSNITLWSLIERAAEAGVKLGELPENLRRVQLPVWHNEVYPWNDGISRNVLIDGQNRSVMEADHLYGVRTSSTHTVGIDDRKENQLVNLEVYCRALHRSGILAKPTHVQYCLSGT